MNFPNFLSLAVVCESALMFCHFIATGQSMPQWDDLPPAAAVVFVAPPYGQICVQWIKEKLGTRYKDR
jgi:hypothetical protein